MTDKRQKLQKIKEYRGTFTGTFRRFGEKRGFNGYPETTLLLLKIKDEKETVVADHLWFNYMKGFQNLGKLTVGAIIQFDARVKEYYKGYQGYRDDVERSSTRDYKLSHPTKLSVIGVDKVILKEMKQLEELEKNRGKYEELKEKVYNKFKSKYQVKKKSTVECHLNYNLQHRDLCCSVVDLEKTWDSLSNEEIEKLMDKINQEIKEMVDGFGLKKIKTLFGFSKKGRKKMLFKAIFH